MRILVTGGCGFIGSHFIRLSLKERAAWQVVNLDKLTYAGNPENLCDVEKDPRYTFVKGDISDPVLVDSLLDRGIDWIVNFAAESHVDRSIEDPAPFVTTNVHGVQVLLEAARQHPLRGFLQVSTDEVYGSLGPTGSFSEESPLRPTSPYAATKAAADLLSLAYHKSFGVPVLISRSSNNYGPYQYPEKLIPLLVTNALEEKPLPVYGDGQNVRDWIYTEDNCRGILCLMEQGSPGEIFNLGGNAEMRNIEIARLILQELSLGEERVRFVTDRPAHDFRYALATDKAREHLGWTPTQSFRDGLRQTIAWYRNNEAWWRPIKDGDFRIYYERRYAKTTARSENIKGATKAAKGA